MHLLMLAALGFLTSPAPSHAFVDKPLPDRDGAAATTCRECHTHKLELAAMGALTVEGLPERYTPGQSYTLTLSLTYPAMRRGGFQASVRDGKGAQAGTLSVADTRAGILTDKDVQFAHHTKAGTRGREMNTWTVTWTAPAAAQGALTFRAAGNASNGDDSPLGDVILFLSREIKAP